MRHSFTHKVEIEGYEWKVSLDIYNELSFVFYEIFHDPDEGQWWDGSDDFTTTYRVPNVKDNALPDGLSSVRVMRRIIEEIIAVLNRSKTDFFYFKPTTDRKADFYVSIFERYLHRLRGEWEYQIIDKKWFYFRKIS
jgi:hypothetical protein